MLVSYCKVLKEASVTAVGDGPVAVSRWVPEEFRGRAMTRIHASYSLGTVLGLAATPLLVTRMGWPAALQAFAAGGLAWVVSHLTVILKGSARRSLKLGLCSSTLTSLPHSCGLGIRQAFMIFRYDAADCGMFNSWLS